uniref:small monomeric GTPase n=1 Tax=Strigamia maritima TaxID=126957 RepID=T1JN28_STRMM
MVDGEPVIFELLDGVIKDENDLPREEVIQWADAFLLVYSITDRSSFNFIKTLRQHIYETKTTPKDYSQGSMVQFPISIVANKCDLMHLRQVSFEEGEILSKDLDGIFTELSAAEHVSKVIDAFCDLCREVHAARRRSKQSLLERMLGKK